MANRSNLAVALLAAGSSVRFGDEDKLAVLVEGMPLGGYAANAMPTALAQKSWVIASKREHACAAVWRQAGFELEVNPHAQQGMGTSVALAAQLAVDARCDALLIALADMPLVTTEHFEALIAAVGEPDSIAASAIGDIRLPPAVFGSAHFAALASLGGDRGARSLLARADVIACPPKLLLDIDTPQALEHARIELKD